MPKLRVLSASQVCKILQKGGFVAVRQTGGHIICDEIYRIERSRYRCPNHSEIARGTLKSIIQQSELPKSAFVN